MRQYNRMKERVLMCVLGLGGVASLAGAQHAALTPRDSALHALNRLAYGPGRETSTASPRWA